jgi:hypothetical protein
VNSYIHRIPAVAVDALRPENRFSGGQSDPDGFPQGEGTDQDQNRPKDKRYQRQIIKRPASRLVQAPFSRQRKGRHKPGKKARCLAHDEQKRVNSRSTRNFLHQSVELLISPFNSALTCSLPAVWVPSSSGWHNGPLHGHSIPSDKLTPAAVARAKTHPITASKFSGMKKNVRTFSLMNFFSCHLTTWSSQGIGSNSGQHSGFSFRIHGLFIF